jgi:hypothetical protein
VLDEAFKSRIHFKIYYPDLSLEQTLDIWKLNIHRVRRIEKELAKVENREPLLINENELIAFARNRFRDGGVNRRGHGRWNGRQIRNAFQVACSLAYYEYGNREEEQRARRRSSSNTNATCPVKARDSLSGPPNLSVRHFETMHEITASFENYRTAVHGGTTDADLALEAESRHDGYRDSLTEGMQAEYRDDHLRAAAGTDEGADGSDYSAADTALPLTSTVTGRSQRIPQRVVAGDDTSAAENFIINQEHRGSYTSRTRSGSYRSNAASPLNMGFGPVQGQQQQQQQTMFPSPSPRHGVMRDTSSGSQDLSGSYTSAGPPRTGYPAQNYNNSPRNSSGNIYGPFGHPPASQYGNDVGGMGEGRDYGPRDYFSSGSNSLSPTGREGSGTFLASGSQGLRSWSSAGGGQVHMNQHAGHGRDYPSRPGQNAETDLSPDEGSY